MKITWIVAVIVLVFIYSNVYSQKMQNKQKLGQDSTHNDEIKGNDISIIVENPPEFPSGEEARTQFIAKNLMYPDSARVKGIQGIVFVSFIVETDGSLSNIYILKGIGFGCDEEAIRLIKLMPKWKPGTTLNGKEIRIKVNMPVKFDLK